MISGNSVFFRIPYTENDMNFTVNEHLSGYFLRENVLKVDGKPLKMYGKCHENPENDRKIFLKKHFPMYFPYISHTFSGFQRISVGRHFTLI